MTDNPKPELPCPICRSTVWRWREADKWGGPGGWVCARCYPRVESTIGGM